jgi:hypothetical protein
MKKSLILAALIGLCASAFAQEVKSQTQVLNETIQTCMTSMAKGMDGMDAGTKGFMTASIPKMCREAAVVVPEAKEESTASVAGRVALGLAQVWAGYKGQALVWGAVSSMVNRGYQSTENVATQGLQTAESLGQRDPVIVGPSEGMSVLNAPAAYEN